MKPTLTTVSFTYKTNYFQQLTCETLSVFFRRRFNTGISSHAVVENVEQMSCCSLVGYRENLFAQGELRCSSSQPITVHK